ncbi:MAG: hypothetical protein KAT65_21695 [Methanophagales archaeon]|nr:hypothetical protein [Methanophagales archaeon]
MLNIVETTWITVLLTSIAIIAAIIVPITLYLLSKRKKKLICKLFPSLSLVDVRTEVKDKIEIYYNKNLVENLSMTKVKIRNNGNLPIRKEDIVKPLEFNFGENLSVIDYSVIDTEPRGITANLKPNTENNLIRCSFDLLNPSDGLTLQFVCLGESKELPNITARIEGIKQVDVETILASEERVERMRKLGNLYVATGLMLFFMGTLGFVLSREIFMLGLAVYSILIIIGGILTKKQKLGVPKMPKIFR